LSISNFNSNIKLIVNQKLKMRKVTFLKHFVRLVVWLICFNCFIAEMPVHHKKLYNFMVNKLENGAYFYHSPTGKFNLSKLNFKYLVLNIFSLKIKLKNQRVVKTYFTILMWIQTQSRLFTLTIQTRRLIFIARMECLLAGQK